MGVITDSSFQTMQNGNRINPGQYHANFCSGLDGYYPDVNSMIVLPDSEYANGYYLIHRTKNYEDRPCKNFNYTYIDMSLNNGLGAVTEKKYTHYR